MSCIFLYEHTQNTYNKVSDWDDLAFLFIIQPERARPNLSDDDDDDDDHDDSWILFALLFVSFKWDWGEMFSKHTKWIGFVYTINDFILFG